MQLSATGYEIFWENENALCNQKRKMMFVSPSSYWQFSAHKTLDSIGCIAITVENLPLEGKKTHYWYIRQRNIILHGLTISLLFTATVTYHIFLDLTE